MVKLKIPTLSALAVLGALLLLPLISPPKVSAAVAPGCDNSNLVLGIPPWYKYLDVGPQTFRDDNGNVKFVDDCAILGPKNEEGQFDPLRAIGPIVLAGTEILLRIGTYLAIGVVIYGGFQYQISQGEPERTKNARTMIINAIVGLVVAILATAIVNLVGRNFY